MRCTSFAVLSTTLLLLLVACSRSIEETCPSLCTNAGYSGSASEEHDSAGDVCRCVGDGRRIESAACSRLCDDIGERGGEVSGEKGDTCRCTD